MAHGSQNSFRRALKSLDGRRGAFNIDASPGGWSAEFSNESQSMVGRESLVKCQQVLSRGFCMCRNHDSEDLACAISCTLSSSRPLHTSELQDAVAMHAYAQHSREEWRDRSTMEFRIWLARFGALFAVDDTGYIFFGIAEMSYFLRSFRIRGIDASHRTIAMICLAFIDLNDQWSVESISCPFSSYAAQNWEYHYQIAARSSISLRYRTRNTLKERRLTAHKPQRSSCSSMDMMQTNFEKLDIEDEAEGWVSVMRHESSW